MISFQDFHLSEAIEKSSLNSLRTEAQMFSKNIRSRIQNGKDLFIVAQAYAKWTQQLDTTIFQQLLGINYHSFDQNKESFTSKQLRIKMWNLVTETNPFIESIRHNDMRIYTPGKNHGAEHAYFRYDEHSQDIWNRLYENFNKNRNSIYAKYSKLVREAFDAFDEWLEDKPNSLTNHHNIETFKHNNVTIRIITPDDTNPKYDTSERDYIHSVDVVLKRVRDMGVGNYVDHLIFELDRANSTDSAAGTYDVGGKVVRSTIWGRNDPRVIAHEIGHHLFKFMLNEKQRIAWDNYMKHGIVSFSVNDFVNIHRALHLSYKTLEPHFKDSYVVDGVWENATQYITDSVTKELYAAYLHQQHISMNVLKGKIEKDFEDFRKEVKPFIIHAPTAYSSKNTEEAFCEVFSFVVVGRQLIPLIAHQFTLITGLLVH